MARHTEARAIGPQLHRRKVRVFCVCAPQRGHIVQAQEFALICHRNQNHVTRFVTRHCHFGLIARSGIRTHKNLLGIIVIDRINQRTFN